MIGIPGGGSSLDRIDEACAVGIEFVLARTETHAAIIAAVTGALTGKPGVVLVGVGPGAASTVNGIAYAHLERAPLLLFTDGPASSLHQAFDQSALFAPITKSQGRLRPGRDTGHQLAVFGGRGARLFTLDGMCRLYLRDGKLRTVTDEVPDL